MVQGIETLRAELHALRLTDAEVLEQRQIHTLDARTAHYIAALVAELPGLRHRIELLECRPAYPGVGRWGAKAGIGLPSVPDECPRTRTVPPDGQPVASTEQETVFGIEQGGSVLGPQVERILGQVVLSRHQRGRRSGHVQRRDIVQTLREPVRREETQVARELPRERYLQRMVSRAGVIRDQADGPIVANAGRITTGVLAPLLGVFGGGAGTVNGRVRLNEAR